MISKSLRVDSLPAGDGHNLSYRYIKMDLIEMHRGYYIAAPLFTLIY
jgi:hypothetical protein